MNDVRRDPSSPPVAVASPEQALSASDKFLELLPIATVVCDSVGRIVQYNKRALEIWGRAPQPGDTLDQVYANPRFLDASGHELRRSRVADVLETGQPFHDEEVTI